jgi:CHAT domain-containing protein
MLERAADISREIGYEAGWTAATLNLSNFLPSEQAERQAELLTEVLTSKAGIGDRLGEAVTLANLAAAYRAMGRPDDARAALLRSLDISRPAGFFESASASSFALGDLYEADGDPTAAEAAFAEAVELIESARPNVPLADKFRVGFIRSRGGGGAYDRLVDLLVARGAYDQAFEVVQRSKSRALLEVLATTAFEPTAPRTGTFAQLLAEESHCLERLQVAELRASTGDPGGNPLDEVRQLDAIYDEMDTFDPEYVSLRRGTPASLVQLRNWLQAQERPILLVEYFLTDERLTVFLLRSDWDSVQVHVEPFTLAEAWNGFRQFQRDVVQYQNAGGDSWTMMSRMLTEPLTQHLQPNDLIYLVPHRVLHGLPIHALPLVDEPLATLHPVAYTPTSGLLPLAQNVKKGTGKLESCAAFGVVFEQEAREVAAVFGTDPIEAADLMSENIPELCRNADVCHFSCHGYFNAVDPLSSGLLLRHDPSRRPEPTDILTARDVMRMRLRSELISLSACKTALSEVSQGDELLGLIRAFLYAGSSSLVASLWSVDADTTRRLMVAFYRNLRDQYAKCGAIDKAAALQAAEIEMIESVGSRWSFLWSPFILVGDWH